MSNTVVPMRHDEIPRLRRRLDWSPQRLADELGITDTHLNKMQSGSSKMRRVYGLALRYIELQYLGGPEQ